MSDMEKALQRIRSFRDARDWMQFHNPKNLACALVVEASELLELFQWATPEQSAALSDTKREEITHEMADVAVYLFELADILQVNLFDAIQRKMDLNEAKYPVDKAKGSSRKYTEL